MQPATETKTLGELRQRELPSGNRTAPSGDRETGCRRNAAVLHRHHPPGATFAARHASPMAPFRRKQGDDPSPTAAVLLGMMALASATASRASAEPTPLNIAGNVHSQNLVRHPNVREYQFIQQRTTLRMRWVWAPATVPPQLTFGTRLVSKLRIALEFRATYDSVYDYTPTFRERDLRGRTPSRVASRDLGDLSRRARASIRSEHQIRQAYLELELRRVPLRLRLGRQQIVWGEADFFRMLDRANPLDISWHGTQELPPPRVRMG